MLISVTTGGHRNHAWWNPRATLSWLHPLMALGKLAWPPPWTLPQENWLQPSQKSWPQCPGHGRTGLPRSGEMGPPNTTGVGELPWWHGCRRAGSDSHLRWAAPAAWTDQFSYHPGPHLGPIVGLPWHLLHLGTCKRTGPLELYPQDLQNEERLWNIQESFVRDEIMLYQNPDALN